MAMQKKIDAAVRNDGVPHNVHRWLIFTYRNTDEQLVM